jgi:hypothetical protein
VDCILGSISKGPTIPHWAVEAFRLAFLSELAAAGVNIQAQAEDTPGRVPVITAQIVRADPGDWYWRPLGGHAVFEIYGQVRTAKASLGEFHASGVKRWGGLFGDNSEALLTGAARLAGERAAAQVIDAIADR